MALTGEVQELRDGHWRTVRLGDTVRVSDRRRIKPDGPYHWTRDPLGLNREQRAASNRAQSVQQFAKALDLQLDPWQEAIIDAAF